MIKKSVTSLLLYHEKNTTADGQGNMSMTLLSLVLLLNGRSQPPNIWYVTPSVYCSYSDQLQAMSSDKNIYYLYTMATMPIGLLKFDTDILLYIQSS